MDRLDFIFNTEFKQLQARDNHSRLVNVLALRAGGRGRHRPDEKEDTRGNGKSHFDEERVNGDTGRSENCSSNQYIF
jgi:hypothetical protein